jgi:Endonuclease I/Secretion system C-terminal sorting domain
MKKLYFFLILIFSSQAYSQVVINELDGDTVGSDLLEFVELKSATPNYSLTGLVLVFFNGGSAGNSNLSYQAFDLDGYSTDLNGILLVGRSGVTPTPSVVFSSAFVSAGGLQNGPDGVGLYIGNPADFPTNTAATNTNLMNGFAYASTATISPTVLMGVFGMASCPFESQPTGSISKSFQRKNDGSWEVKPPTPGLPNDGSGTVLNYVTTTTNLVVDPVTTLPTITEGQSINFTFTTSAAVTTTPLVVNFSLTNGNFTTTDYSGTLTATIPVGSSSVTKTIMITNDLINDGDEEALFSMLPLASGYTINNNNFIIRVNNINFTVLPFGTPANPTFGQVANTKPVSYYNSIEGLSGAALKQALQDIIANPAVVHGQNYGDIYDILRTADQNPENSNQVWLIYTEEGRSKLDEQSGSNNIGKYNREHIYCQSRGGFADATSAVANGINNWDPAGPDIIATGHADAHHIRAVDANENSSRNDRNYGVDYNGPAGSTSNAWKGDVARALFYMGVRYNSLHIDNGNPSGTPDGHIGDLATLLTWNHLDPADDFEMNRNNYIYTWQINRNPFIDYPTLADYIYGSNYGQTWHAPALGTVAVAEFKVSVLPNPTTNFIQISGIEDTATVVFYNSLGNKVLSVFAHDKETIYFDFATGIYNVRIVEADKSVVKKLVVR